MTGRASAQGEGLYNVVVIGGGTAGLVTAAGTAGRGGRVAVVEKHRMVGDCLNSARGRSLIHPRYERALGVDEADAGSEGPPLGRRSAGL
ncbi:MAG TPA: FAD-dependent oxidoreductase [Vicinamibacteria bacterium]|nr:FAD-dependent oxidoreductase [Vicinamibacteria bacterium]